MFLPLLTLTLGVMVVGLDAGKPFYEVQQQQQMPPEEGILAEAVDDLPEAPENLAADIGFASIDMSAAPSPFGKVWCDSRYYCQTGQTCCRRSGSKWGCCPFTGGTCCYLGKVCCPPGRRCSNPPGRCYWSFAAKVDRRRRFEEDISYSLLSPWIVIGVQPIFPSEWYRKLCYSYLLLFSTVEPRFCGWCWVEKGRINKVTLDETRLETLIVLLSGQLASFYLLSVHDSTFSSLSNLCG
jgi:hypothetical protein